MDWGFLNFMAVMVSIGLAVSLPFGAVHVFKALATRLERKDASGAADIDSLNRRIVELEEINLRQMESVSQRLEELEERVDFAERLLASEKKPAQIQGER